MNEIDNELRDKQAYPDTVRRRHMRTWAAAAMVMILLLSGCGERTYTFLGAKRTPRKGLMTKEELMEALGNFEESTTAILRETSTRIQQEEPDRKIRQSDLIKNVRLTQAYSTMLAQYDPIVAFLEVWGLTVRLRLYVESGQGSTLYGDHQELVVETMRRIESKIEDIGRNFMGAEEFSDAQRQILRFAEQHPVQESFSNLVIYATQARPGQPPPFAEVIAIPMAPFTALRGVDRTASAIFSVRQSMDRITDVVEQLPESVRWELMLLLMELDDAPVVESLLTSVSTLSESSARFADTAEKLPHDLREQASVLVKEIDEKQANAQATLEKTERAAVAIEQSLAAAKSTFEQVGLAAQTIKETAREWESAVGATSGLVTDVTQWSQGRPEKDPNNTTSVKDYQATLQSVNESATELRALLADARDLVESRSLTARIAEVDSLADKLTARVFWRLVQLAAVIFALTLAYRLVLLRFRARGGS